MANRGVSQSIALVILIFAVSILVPSVILSLESPQDNTFSQDVGDRTVITGDLSSRITSITNQDGVNVSMFDRKSGEFNSTGELLPGETATVRLEGEDINVTVVDVFTTNTAVIRYVYPVYIGWPEGAGLIADTAPQLILLSTVLFAAGLLAFITRGIGK